MKFIVDVRPYKKEFVTTALESGADLLIADEKDTERIKKLGIIEVIAGNGDIVPEKDIFFIEIKSKDDELRAAELAKKGPIVVLPKDWKIIPLENLIAQVKEIYVYADDIEELRTAASILEKGVTGVVLKPKSISQIKEFSEFIKRGYSKMNLEPIKIVEVKQLGMGDRVCIDTIENMTVGEGMLVGNASDGFFLVHSESIDNPYVNARPFRVNAGGVHCYIFLPEDKTAYLSELKTGDELLIVNHDGTARVSFVGRIKQEKRPMLLVIGKFLSSNRVVSVVLQNAETIRLVKKDGSPVSVVELNVDDEVLGFSTESGRHFGMKIKETIVEK